MSRLNPAQHNSVLASFRHLDGLLVEAVRILREDGDEELFTQHVADAAPDQVRGLEDSIRDFRLTLLRVLDDWGIDRPNPRTSALHAARVNLRYAEMALEDLRPRALRGYGEVAPQAADEIEGVVAELRELLRHMRELLSHGPDREPAARLERPPDDGV
jgi:hypothetical protein